MQKANRFWLRAATRLSILRKPKPPNRYRELEVALDVMRTESELAMIPIVVDDLDIMRTESELFMVLGQSGLQFFSVAGHLSGHSASDYRML